MLFPGNSGKSINVTPGFKNKTVFALIIGSMNTQATLFSKNVTLPIVIIGPFLTVYLLVNQLGPTLFPGQLALALLVGLTFWSPVFFSVPAFLTQDGRDRIDNEAKGFARLKRSFTLIPKMLKKENGIQIETIASLASFTIATLLSMSYLMTLPALF